MVKRIWEVGRGSSLSGGLKDGGMRAGGDLDSQGRALRCGRGQQNVRGDSSESWAVRRWPAAVGGGNVCALTRQSAADLRACQG